MFFFFSRKRHVQIKFCKPSRTIGSSDFGFFTFLDITTHPCHPMGPRIWKLAQKNFLLHPWLAKFFVRNRKMLFLFQSLILGTPFDGSFPFFQHVLFMGFLIHIPKTQTISLNCGGTSSQGQTNIIVATFL
jgi:hypothetical protein